MNQEPSLNIIHCFRSPVGGIFRHVRDLAIEHHKLGHKVGILCDSNSGGDFEEALFDKIMPYLDLGVVRIPMERSIGISDIKAAVTSFQKIKSLQPDILHGHGAKGGAYARIIGSKLRVSRYCVARFYSPHGGSLHYRASSIRGRAYFTIERILERFSNHIVFVSQYERDTYFDKIGKPKVAYSVNYNGLNEEEFTAVRPQKNAADFLYIGMMRDLKGPDLFINAFAQAERILKRPLSAVMVGDGEQKEEYQKKITTSGLGERIHMHPSMVARDAFKLAKNVVIPSRAEAMPYIALEAIAAGKPVLASNVGGIPEILGKDSPALIQPNDINALAERMALAVEDKKWLKSTSPEKRAFQDTFSSKAMAARLMELYQASVDTKKSAETT